MFALLSGPKVESTNDYTGKRLLPNVGSNRLYPLISRGGLSELFKLIATNAVSISCWMDSVT